MSASRPGKRDRMNRKARHVWTLGIATVLFFGAGTVAAVAIGKLALAQEAPSANPSTSPESGEGDRGGEAEGDRATGEAATEAAGGAEATEATEATEASPPGARPSRARHIVRENGDEASEQRAGVVVAAPRSRFEVRDIYIDPEGEALAAWQFELLDPERRVTVVGIEGGEHPAFAKAPYYDAAALARGRVVVAAFDVGSDLPRARTRVARLHVEIRGEGDPRLEARLVVAGDANGREVSARVTVEKLERAVETGKTK